MAFKLTYSDGHETNYDDSTKWDVDAGVLKLGREEGNWTVLLSPSHWATLEIASEGDDDKDDDKSEDKDSDDKDDDKDDDDS